MKKPIITVVGSMNMDLIVKTSRRPSVGETIIGNQFITKPGGKGANQAVAAARLGAEVHMIGLVGDDYYGKELIRSLEKENIYSTKVEPVTDCSTGVASIVLSEEDNSIIIVPGANSLLTPEYLHQKLDVLLKSEVIITQLEIPLETVGELSHLCQKHDKMLILNPAPAQDLPEQIIRNSRYLTPNQIELDQLKKHHPNLIQEHSEKVVVTDGKNGSYFYHNQEIQRVKAFTVQPVDTTGAGDCFNGALAYALAIGQPLVDACRFANAAGALAVQKLGAQEGMPTREEVEDLLHM